MTITLLATWDEGSQGFCYLPWASTCSGRLSGGRGGIEPGTLLPIAALAASPYRAVRPPHIVKSRADAGQSAADNGAERGYCQVSSIPPPVSLSVPPPPPPPSLCFVRSCLERSGAENPGAARTKPTGSPPGGKIYYLCSACARMRRRRSGVASLGLLRGARREQKSA